VSTKCDIDPQIVQETYEGRFGGESQEVKLSKYPKAKPADNDMLLRPTANSGTSFVTRFARMFVYNLNIMLDIVSGLQLSTSSRPVVPFG
jgi:hypothetical protein